MADYVEFFASTRLARIISATMAMAVQTFSMA